MWYSPRYSLQRKGRKNSFLFFFLTSFQNIKSSTWHSLKITNFLALLSQIHRIVTHLIYFNYLWIHFLIFKLSHLWLTEVRSSWIQVIVTWPQWSLASLSAQDTLGSFWTFPIADLELAISTRATLFFKWQMIYRDQNLNAWDAHCYQY